MSDQLGDLTARIAALDRPIRTWRDARDRAFAAAFTPKEGKLSTLMSRLPKAAAAATGVGPGPREQTFAVLDEVCDLYLRSDAMRCAVIRGIVHEHELHHLLDEYVGHATQMLASGGLALWLDRGLAAASIDDQRRDYRDWLVAVGDLYIAAHRASIDPSPAMRRMSERSNPEPHRAAPTPTRQALAGFEQSAHFGTSVLPRLR